MVVPTRFFFCNAPVNDLLQSLVLLRHFSRHAFLLKSFYDFLFSCCRIRHPAHASRCRLWQRTGRRKPPAHVRPSQAMVAVKTPVLGFHASMCKPVSSSARLAFNGLLDFDVQADALPGQRGVQRLQLEPVAFAIRGHRLSVSSENSFSLHVDEAENFGLVHTGPSAVERALAELVTSRTGFWPPRHGSSSAPRYSS